MHPVRSYSELVEHKSKVSESAVWTMEAAPSEQPISAQHCGAPAFLQSLPVAIQHAQIAQTIGEFGRRLLGRICHRRAQLGLLQVLDVTVAGSGSCFLQISLNGRDSDRSIRSRRREECKSGSRSSHKRANLSNFFILRTHCLVPCSR